MTLQSCPRCSVAHWKYLTALLARGAREAPPPPTADNRILRRALTEREAEPEATASSSPQEEDEYDEEPDWLNAVEREELESRIRELALNLTDLRWDERNAFLRFLSSEVFYNSESDEQ